MLLLYKHYNIQNFDISLTFSF